MSNIAKIISIIILLSFNSSLYSQNVNYKGKVVDYETLEPLTGVHVKCANNNTTTNLNGDFTITVGKDEYDGTATLSSRNLELKEGVSVRVKNKGYKSYLIVNGEAITYDEIDCGTYDNSAE